MANLERCVIADSAAEFILFRYTYAAYLILESVCLVAVCLWVFRQSVAALFRFSWRTSQDVPTKSEILHVKVFFLFEFAMMYARFVGCVV